MASDYINLSPEELERLEREAYNAGDTDRASLLAAVLELQEAADKLEELEELEDEIKALKNDTENHEAYKQFFEDCFDRLDKHYPCAEVTSNYDCSVIFDAIERGESARLDAEAKGDEA